MCIYCLGNFFAEENAVYLGICFGNYRLPRLIQRAAEDTVNISIAQFYIGYDFNVIAAWFPVPQKTRLSFYKQGVN